MTPPKPPKMALLSGAIKPDLGGSFKATINNPFTLPIEHQ